MKLLFLCGSVESGKDGVGDYTRRLGLELVAQGHEVKIVALNDQVTAESCEHLILETKYEIEVFRFPSSLSWENRVAKLDRLLNIFNPDWISLQYVPYSFQKKGLPYNFATSLKLIGKRWRWHIMFHETWIGIKDQSPLKHRLVGPFQKRAAHLVIQSVMPEKITTSNRLYQLVLEKANISASIMPLFSNIPVTTICSKFQNELFEQLVINGLNRNNYILLGIFGRLHEGYDFASVINEELNKARSLNKKLIFLSLGKIDNVAEFDKLKSIFHSKIDFHLLGELPEEKISSTLQLLDIGISCTPLEYIGKSGVYAAMRLHNVKVLLPFSEKVLEFESEIITYNNYLHSRPLHKWGVEYIALKFVNFLNGK
jgi:hypothetical protein